MGPVLRLERRQFLQLTGLAGGALLLGAGPVTAEADPKLAGWSPDVFLSLEESGKVTIVAHRSEMGQGIRTSLPMVVADEMEADWARVHVEQALADKTYGDQNTDGSRSIVEFFERMRQAGATARTLLVAAAAASFGVDPKECQAKAHRVLHAASGRSLGYGELAAKAAALPVPPAESLVFKPRSEWRYVGRPRTLVDVRDIATGQAGYGIDARVPEMLHAVVARCPAVGGQARSYDEAAAKAVAGVKAVVRVPGAGLAPGFQPLGGIAVVGETTWAAIQGREALKVEWDLGPNGSYDSEAYRKELTAAAEKPGLVVRRRGDVEAALAGAARRLTATYYAPHLSQSPMEPPCALAHVTEGACEVWAPTQNPQGTAEEVGKGLGLDASKVTVHVTLLGGGFGRKSKPDVVVEAAIVSRAVGRPVKVTWTREDDVRHGYYHSVSCQKLEAGLDDRGRTVAWKHRSVFPPIGATWDPKARHGDAGELAMGLVDVPFEVPHLQCENGEAQAHVRIGWLRSVANIYHAFAVSSFADELAHAAGRDPKEYLLELIGPPRKIDLGPEGVKYDNYGQPLDRYPIDTARLRNVVETAASKAGWGKPLPAGGGRGIAVHRSFLTYVATVVQVAVEGGDVRVEEVQTAVDCGTVVNPDTVETQLQGAVVFGLSLALEGEITAKAGAIVQGNFDDYPILRISRTPRTIGVTIVPSEAPPAGIGEPGVPPVAPALANAIFAATGRRLRELPLRKALRA